MDLTLGFSFDQTLRLNQSGLRTTKEKKCESPGGTFVSQVEVQWGDREGRPEVMHVSPFTGYRSSVLALLVPSDLLSSQTRPSLNFRLQNLHVGGDRV